MIVIAHQAVGVIAPMLLLNLMPEKADKLLAIGVVEKDELWGIAACSDVVQRTGKFETQRSSHETGRETERGAKSRTDPRERVLDNHPSAKPKRVESVEKWCREPFHCRDRRSRY